MSVTFRKTWRRFAAAAPLCLMSSLGFARSPDSAALPAGAPGAEHAGDPYPLDTCPVSGMTLGSMGDPIVKTYDGREIRFCCAACPSKFEAEAATYEQRIDEQIADRQRAYYPLETCAVSGDPLPDEGEAVERVVGNRLVRLCCEGCTDQLEADPAQVLKTLDAAAAERQREAYPLDACPVSGMKLGSMGDPAEIVVAGRLVKLCCGGCEPKVRAEPAKYLGQLDRAWARSGVAPGASGDAVQIDAAMQESDTDRPAPRGDDAPAHGGGHSGRHHH